MGAKSGSENHRYKHGNATRLGHSTEYGIWVNMKTRCLNPRNRAYQWYGIGIWCQIRWVEHIAVTLILIRCALQDSLKLRREEL